MSKQLTVKVINGKTEFNRVFNVDNKAKDNDIFGKVIDWIFKASDLYRQVSKGHPKANEITDLQMKCDGFKWDTLTVEAGLKDKFKFGTTAKSKRNFARNMWAVYQFVTDDFATKVTIEQVIQREGALIPEISAN